MTTRPWRPRRDNGGSSPLSVRSVVVLPGAVGSDQGDDLARAHDDVDVVDDRLAPVPGAHRRASRTGAGPALASMAAFIALGLSGSTAASAPGGALDGLGRRVVQARAPSRAPGPSLPRLAQIGGDDGRIVADDVARTVGDLASEVETTISSHTLITKFMSCSMSSTGDAPVVGQPPDHAGELVGLDVAETRSRLVEEQHAGLTWRWPSAMARRRR